MVKGLVGRLLGTAVVVAALGLAAAPAMAASKCIKGDRKAPYTIGWANIYSVPTWMKQTQGTIEDVVNAAEEAGPGRQARRHRRQGNANTQIQQIQSMIDANVDAIMVDRRLLDRARPRDRATPARRASRSPTSTASSTPTSSR